jgi:hypothetical protein
MRVTERLAMHRSECVPSSALVTLMSTESDGPFDAWSSDISLEKVHLICQEPMPIGLAVSLDFHPSSSRVAIDERLSGRVSDVRVDVEASVVGVEFSEILSRWSAPALVRTIERLRPGRSSVLKFFGGVASRVRRLSATSAVLLFLIWLTMIGTGYLLLAAYHARPGPPGSPARRWPEESPIGLDPTRPTLLIFLHPRCPCSGASVAELASISACFGDRFAAHAILYRPDGPAEGWDKAEGSATDEVSIPGLRRWIDHGGRLARQFGVETSGHILLFEPAGTLLFSGGITASRGHRGENLGLDALVARIEREETGPRLSPIFGCPMLEPGSTSRTEVTR